MGVEAAWSHESLFAGAFLIPAERTRFRGVYNVPPGHFMRATPEGFRLQQYWDVNYPRDDAAPAPTSGGAPGVRCVGKQGRTKPAGPQQCARGRLRCGAR
jgi:hypothetical protein